MSTLERITMKMWLIGLKVAQYLCLATSVLLIVFLIPEGKISSLISWSIVFFVIFIFLLFLIPKFSKFNAKNNSQKRWEDLISTLDSNKKIELSRQEVMDYCNELVNYYESLRALNRSGYYFLQISVIILAGITPILVLINQSQANIPPSLQIDAKLLGWIRWLPVILPALAAILTTISTAFPFLENWINSKNTAEILEAEREKFIVSATEDYLVDDTDASKRKAIGNFVTVINEVHLQEVQNSANLLRNFKEREQKAKAEAATKKIEEFNALIIEGDKHKDNQENDKAIAAYQKALELNVDDASNKIAQNKING